jgi:predicted Zn-ribbon and HTH transcriptional regulator
MGCCGRSNNPSRVVRSQKTEKSNNSAAKSAIVQRTVGKQLNAKQKIVIAQPAAVKKVLAAPQRQSIQRGGRCSECGSVTLMVNIAGREREQCSSANCRKIKR